MDEAEDRVSFILPDASRTTQDPGRKQIQKQTFYMNNLNKEPALSCNIGHRAKPLLLFCTSLLTLGPLIQFAVLLGENFSFVNNVVHWTSHLQFIINRVIWLTFWVKGSLNIDLAWAYCTNGSRDDKVGYGGPEYSHQCSSGYGHCWILGRRGSRCLRETGKITHGIF